MQVLKRQIYIVFWVVLWFFPAEQVRAELVATNFDTKFVSLTPLRNGLSTVTLVWPIDTPTVGRITALRASLSSVVFGGTLSRSARDVDSFLHLKGIEQNISINGRNLSLTVSAANEVFPETLSHLENLLLEPSYSRGWYAREIEKMGLKISTKNGRPSDVLKEVAQFLVFGPDDASAIGNDGEFRFGRPSQIILRSADEEAERRVIRLLKKLPKTNWKQLFSKWATSLTDTVVQPFTLPNGIIRFSDPNSTEMLILFVKAEEFDNESDQIGTNLLVDYIGASQGSEMFRIIRQEMRAAYDPRSDFVILNKKRAILSLSATVEANKWPEIYEKMGEIYENTRGGGVERAGLDIQYDKLNRHYYDRFFNHPTWGVQQYLYEYPNGPDGAITIPVFEALGAVSVAQIVANSALHLPPLEEFLVVLIGGGTVSSETLKSKDYCELPKNTPISFCLDVLSNTLN